MMKARQIGVFLLIGFIWGSEWIARQAIDAPPLRALAMRYAIAAVILVCAITVRPVRFPGWGPLLAAAMIGITLLVIPSVLTLWAAKRISPGLLVVILSLTPLLAALLEGRVSGWLSPLIGGVGGIALVLSSGLSLNLTQLPPIFAVLSSAVLIGGSYVYTKKRLLGVCPVAMAAIQFVTAFLGLACVSLLIEGRSDWIWTRQSLLWDAILASFGNALAFPLYYFLLQRFESFQLTSAQWVVTLVSVTESLIILRQRPSWEILVGFVLIGASLWILLMRHSKEEEPLTIRITHPPFEG